MKCISVFQDISTTTQQSDQTDQPESLETHRPTPGKTSLTPAKV